MSDPSITVEAVEQALATWRSTKKCPTTAFPQALCDQIKRLLHHTDQPLALLRRFGLTTKQALDKKLMPAHPKKSPDTPPIFIPLPIPPHRAAAETPDSAPPRLTIHCGELQVALHHPSVEHLQQILTTLFIR